MRFQDRIEAGKKLGRKLASLAPKQSLVLALPRGGVPLAIEIANQQSLPIDLIFAKKIGHPLHSESAIGAVAEGGQPIMNDLVPVDAGWLQIRLGEIQAEIQRRRQEYSPYLNPQDITGRDVIIVDDGIATGMTMFAAIAKVKEEGAASISVAVPVIPYDTYQKLLNLVDNVYYCLIPDHFLGSVSAYYQSFPQVSDGEVQEMLRKHLK